MRLLGPFSTGSQPRIELGEDPQADGVIVSVKDAGPRPNQICLALVASPLTRALDRSLGLNQVLHDNPDQGSQILDGLIAETKAEIQQAMDQGADGIAYLIRGAEPKFSSPMEYGGHYLEVDRAILADAAAAKFNLLWVAGDEEPYLDFVIDLPANALAWDMETTGVEPSLHRKARGGPLAGNHRDAEIFFAARLASPALETISR